MASNLFILMIRNSLAHARGVYICPALVLIWKLFGTRPKHIFAHQYNQIPILLFERQQFVLASYTIDWRYMYYDNAIIVALKYFRRVMYHISGHCHSISAISQSSWELPDLSLRRSLGSRGLALL
jgi:hypothetical protein